MYGSIEKRVWSSQTLLADVIATKKATFQVRCCIEVLCMSSKGGAINLDKTRFNSYGEAGCLIGGKVFFNTSKKSLTTGIVKKDPVDQCIPITLQFYN